MATVKKLLIHDEAIASDELRKKTIKYFGQYAAQVFEPIREKGETKDWKIEDKLGRDGTGVLIANLKSYDNSVAMQLSFCPWGNHGTMIYSRHVAEGIKDMPSIGELLGIAYEYAKRLDVTPKIESKLDVKPIALTLTGDFESRTLIKVSRLATTIDYLIDLHLNNK